MATGGKVATRRDFRAVSYSLAILLAAPACAAAASCGDDVAGVRVACACGDTVVSDTVLRATDPIVQKRCPFDGLIVRADELSEGLTLNLDGLSIRGSAVGTGIDVQRGGSEGAAVIGGSAQRRGEIVGFNVGLRVQSGRAIRRIEALELEGQRREGLVLHTAGTMLFDVAAVRNGADGIRVMGQGGRLLGVETSENAGAGMRILARDTIVEARAERNARHGIVASGARNDLGGCSASYNTGFGILFTGEQRGTERAAAEGNTVANIVRRQRGTPP